MEPTKPFAPYTLAMHWRHTDYILCLVLEQECEDYTETGEWEPSFLFN